MTYPLMKLVLVILHTLVSLFIAHENPPPDEPTNGLPPLSFQPGRIVRCGNVSVHLSINCWNLLRRLTVSGRVMLVDTFFEDKALGLTAIWDQMSCPEPSSLRSVASRLSTLFREAGIPYLISYSEVCCEFRLLPNDELAETFVRLSSGDKSIATPASGIATNRMRTLQKLLKSLSALLQKNEAEGFGRPAL